MDAPKREAILTAALELFATRGFHGTAVPLVAERAGVGAGTVYRYFASKEALVNEIYQRWKLTFSREVLHRFPVGEPPRVQFIELWKRMGKFSSEHKHVVEFLELQHHAPYLTLDSLRIEQEVMDMIVRFVREAQAKDALKQMEPDLIIALVTGAFAGLVKAAQNGTVNLTPELMAQTAECVWEAFRR